MARCIRDSLATRTFRDCGINRAPTCPFRHPESRRRRETSLLGIGSDRKACVTNGACGRSLGCARDDGRCFRGVSEIIQERGSPSRHLVEITLKLPQRDPSLKLGMTGIASRVFDARLTKTFPSQQTRIALATRPAVWHRIITTRC